MQLPPSCEGRTMTVGVPLEYAAFRLICRLSAVFRPTVASMIKPGSWISGLTYCPVPAGSLNHRLIWTRFPGPSGIPSLENHSAMRPAYRDRRSWRPPPRHSLGSGNPSARAHVASATNRLSDPSKQSKQGTCGIRRGLHCHGRFVDCLHVALER